MELFSYYHMDPANTLLFDIETTGFSAKTCTLYLIGAAVYQGDGMFTGIQWFNESGSQEEEKELLSAFFSFCQSYGTLLHYNGDGFDLPYLKNCAKKHALTPPFSYMQSFDLYKMIRPLKELFKTDSLKLKSIEQFLHISREDRFSGGELIKVYQNYCKQSKRNFFCYTMQMTSVDCYLHFQSLPIRHGSTVPLRSTLLPYPAHMLFLRLH